MIAFVSVLGLFALLLGPAAAYFSLVAPLVGLGCAAAGLGLLALLFFMSLYLLIRFGSRNTPWIAFFLGLVALIGIGAGSFQGFKNPLHDISTSPQSPPLFRHPAYQVRVEKGAEYLDDSLRLNLDYDPANAAPQELLYPEFKAALTKQPPADAYKSIIMAVRTQLPDWKLVLEDPAGTHLEYEFEDPIIHGVTDIAIEVRNNPPAGSKVELRSRLRNPGPDFGWNLWLLHDLQNRLAASLSGGPPAPAPAKPALPAAPRAVAP